jgi:predicted Zn finger-like uncharacterized protein
MDVRCDRCQTEYELDDESVAGAGASVQCTTCGHTFVVSRNGSIVVGTTPPSGLSSGEPTTMGSRSSQPFVPTQPDTQPGGPGVLGGSSAVPEWVLATEEGQTHRLRDLTTLQKWVVERRVGRGDRVSQRGGGWRTLGEVEELRPFFDVVDQADRQTAAAELGPARAEAARAVRPTLPATPRKVQNPVRAHVSPDPDDDDVLSTAQRGRRGRGGDSFLDTDISPDDDDLSLAFKPRRTGLKVVGALAFLGLAAGGGWYLFRQPHAFRLASGTPIPAAATSPGAATPAAAPQTAAAPAAATPAAGAQAPAPQAAAGQPAAPTPAAAAPTAAAAPAGAAAGAPGAAVAPSAPAPSAAPPAKPVAEAPAAAPSEPAKPAHAGAASAAAEPKARSYEQLVAEADHALENGQTAKAQKLYEEALKQQPNGVAALTGSAYVLLDKRHPLAAIGVFKQVLGNAPHYAPALFGLGEAFRGQGEASQAIEAYKQYLEQSPTGTDAPAARRQIKDLGEAAAAPRNPGPSAVVPAEGTATAPPSN